MRPYSSVFVGLFPASSRCQEHGFSLVEIMVAMVLGLILVAAASTAFLALRQSFQDQERIATMKENLRFSVDFMTRDIRGAGLTADGGLNPALGLVPDSPGASVQQRFTVRKAGMNCMGEIGPWVSSVYSVHNRQLRCGDEGSPPQNQTLVEGVRAMRAVALNATGAPDWTAPTALRIELEFVTGSGGNGTAHQVIEFVIALRNPILDQLALGLEGSD